MPILNLGGKGSSVDVEYGDGHIKLLNKLVEWRSHLSAEVDEDGNVIDGRVKESEKTDDGAYVSHTDPASGYGIHIAAATGDGTGKTDANGFQRGHLSSKLEIGDEDNGPHPEIVALVKMAADDEPGLSLGTIDLSTGPGKTPTIQVNVVDKNGNIDVLNLKGQLAIDLAIELSDHPVICEALPTMLDLKNSASQVAVFDYTENENGKIPTYFHGSDADVDSAAVKEILGGSRLDLDEAVELTEYALSEAGQADEDITIDFNGAGVVLEIEASRDTTDTIILKGDAFFDELNTTTFNGKSIVDLKNSNSQIGVFDFDEANSYFHGSDSDVDSAAAKAILGGSSLDAGEAQELIDLALTGEDPNVRYLGGDDDSAIVAIDASRDTTDTLFLSGDVFDIA